MAAESIPEHPDFKTFLEAPPRPPYCIKVCCTHSLPHPATPKCLPFVTEQLKDKIYIGLIFSINLIGFFIMLVSCIYILCRIRKLPETDRKRQEFSMTCMTTLLIVATFISWVPLAVIGYSALADMPLVTAGQAKFFLVFVYPVNACVSPFIYAIFIWQLRQRMKSMVKNTKKMHSSPPAHPLHIKETQSTSEYPTVFGSTVHSVHSDNNTPGSPTYQLPFRLGPLSSLSNNSSLSNLQETEDSEDLDTTAATAAREVRVALNESQASNESMMKHLSVVLEGDEEGCPENDQSAPESDSDAHKSLQAHRPTDVGSRVERSADLDATTTAAAVADSYSGGALCHHSPSPSPTPRAHTSQEAKPLHDSRVEIPHYLTCHLYSPISSNTYSSVSPC